MNFNYKNKRKFNELINNSQSSILSSNTITNTNTNSNTNKTSKITKLNDILKYMNSNDDDDGESNEELFENHEENIYIKDNHLYFHTDVNEKSVDKVKKIMRTYWDKYNTIKKSNSCNEFIPKPLYIHIFSPGGCIYSGLSLYDFIIEYKKKIPIYTVVEGRAASAATFLSIAGTKKFITPNSYILIHQLSTFFGGNYQQIEDEFTNSKKCMEKIIDIYIKHTKINKKQLPGILKHDLNWDAFECVKYGLVDEIKLIDVFNDN